MNQRAYLPYLNTLRRIPNHLILALATRELILDDASACLCGWAWRENLIATVGHDADGGCEPNSEVRCQEAFGGSTREWKRVFGGVVGVAMPDVEEAFARRVMECAGV